MHDTLVKMKDGRVFCSPIWQFRPLEGWMTLINCDEKLYFDDMESAVTEDERLGPCDELARARQMIEAGSVARRTQGDPG